MCKGHEAKKKKKRSSGYLRRWKKFPVHGKQGREWKKKSERKPGARSHRAILAVEKNLDFISYAIRRFYIPIWSNC